jgi:hypothetical protein
MPKASQPRTFTSIAATLVAVLIACNSGVQPTSETPSAAPSNGSTPTPSIAAPTLTASPSVPTPSPAPAGRVVWNVTGSGEVHCLYYGRCFPAFVVHQGSWMPPADWEPGDDTYEFQAGFDGTSYRRATGPLVTAPPPAMTVPYTIALAVIEYSDAANCNDAACSSPFFPSAQTQILCTQVIDVIGGDLVTVAADFDTCEMEVMFWSSELPAKTPGTPSLTWTSSSPRWGSWPINGGLAYGFEVRRCGGANAWLRLADGTVVMPRTFYRSPFNGDPALPDWLADESQWLKPPEPEEGCFDGWMIYLTGDWSEPSGLDWGDAILRAGISDLGPPLTTAEPGPTVPPSEAVDPGRPYASLAFEPWIDMEDPPPLTRAEIDRVIAAAAPRIKTLTGQPYWDTVMTFSCNSPEYCYFRLGGQLAGTTGFDWWPFVFNRGVAGSEVKLDEQEVEDAPGYDPLFQSLPAAVVAQARAIAEIDPVARKKIAELGDETFRVAAWDPRQPDLISVAYGQEAHMGSTRYQIAVWVDLNTSTVVDFHKFGLPS